MKFEKTARIKGTPSEVWALVEDIEAVARCIPGLGDFSEVSPTEFDAVLTQRVGPVTARFNLNTKLLDLDPGTSVTAVSEGRDPELDSWVTAEQVFGLSPAGDETEIAISADVRFTGRVATFGQRIVSTKAEQVVLESLANVSDLLEERRANAG